MAFITLQTTTLTPNWQWGGSTAYLYVWASTPFYEYVTGQYIASGQVGNTQSFCQKITCTVSGTSVTIPQVTLATTVDSSVPNATYTAVLYDSSNRKRYTLLSQFFVDPDYFQDPANAWVSVSGGGTSSSTGNYEYSGQNNGKPYYNLDGEAVSTANNAVVYTGTQWNITNGAGTVLYHNVDDTDFPWTVTSAWLNDAGALPVPTVAEYDTYQTTTWEQVTISNQSLVGPVVPPQWPGPFWNVPQTKQYFEDTFGGEEVPYAAELRSGKTRLNADPAIETIPIAVGTNSGDWIAMTTEVIWLSGEEYDNNFAAAVAGIGATAKTLIITESTNVTATVSVPSTLHLQFESGGKLNISSSQTVTIGSMNPCGSQQIFTGAGNAVFAKNATNGIFHLSWWSGVSDSSSDLTTDFTQAATSLTNNTGGTLHIGPGVWKMDGMTVPSGAWIVGSGQNTNITSGTVIKPYSTSAVDLFTFSGGADRSGIRNLTVSTDGTVSSSSRCIRVVGASGNTTFGLTLDEIHFQATLASSVLLHFDDSGSNYEMVDILINHPLMEVPASGTAIKWDSNNTLTTIVQPSIVCAAGAKCYHVGEAGGGGGWIEVISGDERGPSSNASTQPTNRTITGSIDGVTGVLTATSGAFVQNDVGQPFTRGSASGYIEDLLTATTANTSYSGVSVADGTLTMKRFVPSTLMAYCVWHIVGDHNTINIIGGADEGFRYFLINEAPTNVSPINVKGRTIQSTVSIEDPCVLVFENCALKSQTFIDSAAVTGSLFFHGCSWDRTTINSDGVPDSTTTTPVVIATPRVFGVHDGASRVYTDLSFHEDIQQQFIETRTNFYERTDGATVPLAVFASASESGQPSVRIGKIDPYTWDVLLYYDFYRDDATDGWLQIQGNQAAPNKGIATNCNIQTVGSTFIGGVVSPAQITATQNNYNPGDSSMLMRLNTDATRSITGIGLTTTQRGGEVHIGVNTLTNRLNLENEDAGSSAANRFLNVGGADIPVFQNEMWLSVYDATTARWRTAKLNITGVSSDGTTVTVTLPLAANGSLAVGGAAAFSGTATFNDSIDALDADFGNDVTLSGGADLIFSGTTGQSKILLTDALANALSIAEGATDYLTFVTSNGSEKMTVSKSFLSTSPTATLGYFTGSGGAQTQATDKSTGVTSNTVTTAITMNAASLAAATIVSFTFTNSVIAATDQVVVTHQSGGTSGAYTFNAFPSAGSAVISVRNNTAGALAEAIVLRVSIYRAVSA